MSLFRFLQHLGTGLYNIPPIIEIALISDSRQAVLTNRHQNRINSKNPEIQEDIFNYMQDLPLLENSSEMLELLPNCINALFRYFIDATGSAC